MSALTLAGQNGRQQAQDDDTAASWRPIDLTPYLDGTITPTAPSVGLARVDGLRFLYPGKEHSVIGEMEAGKGWFACGCVAAELREANPVLYVHFEEADPTDTIGRLLALGVPRGAIAECFRFVGPEAPAKPEMVAALLDPAPVLVVFDGVNEAMALHGQEIYAAEGYAAYRRLLVKPAKAVGAATLSADHVVKDPTARGRSPFGTVHKGNGLDGALFLLENTDPFGRGRRGASHLFATKDRPGFLRQHGQPVEGEPGKTFLGVLSLDATGPTPELNVWTPKPREEGAPEHADATMTKTQLRQERIDDKVLGSLADLCKAEGGPVSRNKVKAKVRGLGQQAVDASLERLEIDGRVVMTPGPRNSHLYEPTTEPEA